MKNFWAIAVLAAGMASWAAAESEPSEDAAIVPDFSAAPREHDVAVVIGVEKYRDLPKSDYSGSDARLVKDYLVSLGYPNRNIYLLVDEHATRTDIVKAIEKWLPNQVKPDSKVFIYYSGHGSPDPTSGEAYIVPHDGDPNYLDDTAYPLKRLYGRLGKLQAAEVVVVLDSCFSGSGGRSVLATGARPLVMTMQQEKGLLSPNIAVITATQGTQISSSSPERKHGIFTYEFLKAIKDGAKGLGEIYEKIKPRVEDQAKALNIAQSPSLMPDSDKMRGRFQFAAFTRQDPPKEVKDKELEKKLAAEQEKLAAQERKLKEKEEAMDRKLKEKEASLENESREKAQAEQRSIAADRARMEREAQQERARLERRQREVDQQRHSNEEPAFVPPTF